MCPPELLAEARAVWDECVEAGRQYGYRNSQVTVLAPTGCLVGESLVLTSRGLVRLQSLGNPLGARWQPLDVDVATDEGPRRATRFFINGIEPVVTVETARGYRLQGTPTHRVKVVGADGTWQWKRLADIRLGDRVPLLLGGMVGEPRLVELPPLGDAYWTSDYTTFAPRRMTEDLAEFVGYFMGDGSLHAKGLRLCVFAADGDVVERLAHLGRSLFGLEAAITEREGYLEVAFHSVRLAMWWEACGFAKKPPFDGHSGKGYAPHIPDAILHTNDPKIYAAFLRGLFEADGNVAGDYIYWSTVTESFSRDVQTLLMVLGFVTTRKVDQPTPDKMGSRAVHVLRLLNASTTARFVTEIGLLSARKRALAAAQEHPQAERYDHVPVSREMVDALAPANDSLRRTMLLSLSRHGMVSRRSAVELLERTDDPELRQLLNFFYDEVASAELGEEQLTYDLSVPENVTYVANGFVSHNTIAFMMDCDTTGVEPDIALVKYKQLAGGGLLKIVNRTVPMALSTLGYDDPAIRDILSHIDTHDTIEGAPGLKDEHLPVFDCAFTPRNGTRSIHYRGHLRMMAAVQPFLSGAISKTVNMPRESTVADIRNAYLEGWKLGLKALAIYRDGSKESQPLSTSSEEKAPAESAPVAATVPLPAPEAAQAPAPAPGGAPAPPAAAVP
ncbi:MAG: intein-containing adenosylcobalamin-dependent ribonucleoside-diphosphate reductase, partial [Isosphaeraceae bacterium]|nr:intein-containing adenosylcobalamin-dependent ribonucleoside-diphosphate reductase [Isosphaeraceae bacterium]